LLLSALSLLLIPYSLSPEALTMAQRTVAVRQLQWRQLQRSLRSCRVCAVINGVWQRPVRLYFYLTVFIPGQNLSGFIQKNPNRINEIYTGR
jgi:hypothetical protein